jgi:hypothetical protein
MGLFALFSGEYEQRYLVGVFSTKEKAVEYASSKLGLKRDYIDIDDCELDPSYSGDK